MEIKGNKEIVWIYINKMCVCRYIGEVMCVISSIFDR